MTIVLILFFLLLSSGSALGAAAFGKRYEESLPITTMGSIAILFFAGFLGGLKIGFYALIVLAGAAYCCAVVLIIRRKARPDFWKNFFSPGLCLFLGLYLAMIYFHHGRLACSWDEFSHWMDCVKGMTLVDDFNSSPLLLDQFFPSYIPGMSLFQYFFQKVMLLVVPSASFCEWGVYLSYNVLVVSLLMPFFRNAAWRRFISSGMLLFLIWIAPEIFYGGQAVTMPHYLTTIYIDPFLGIACGAGLAWIYINEGMEKYDVLYLTLLAWVLTLSKDVGLYFAIVLTAAALCKKLICNGWKNKSVWFGAGTIAVGAFLPKILWNAHLAARGIPKAFSSPIDLTVFWQVIRGQSETVQQSIYDGYFNKLLSETTELSIGTPTYPMILMILVLGLCVLYHLDRTNQSPKMNRVRRGQTSRINRVRRSVLFIAVLQVILYAVGMVALYMFKFAGGEATGYASYDRYLRIPFVALLMMGLLIALDWVMRLHDRRYLAALSLGTILCCTIPAGDVWDFMGRSSVAITVNVRSEYEPEAELMESMSAPGEKIYWISQRSYGLDCFIMRFRMKPRQLNRYGWSISADGPLYEGDGWTTTMSPEQWTGILKESYDYVFLHAIDENFVNDYGTLFEDVPAAGTMYRVTPDGETITLVTIGEGGT